ncbi:short-chain dehydrogenase [Actinoplanes sp. ATCC 53533]|uniref:SDR family NAD(P)-dependent oxidoreductase n=1 Tax=Actinoplanes sp. ATCC 53533 TaxID=1288362 RepID=UPI000F7B1093|nr:SDR family oxidoreductase [Actinoplanes sp. ATCC 53533]RSM55821.1 short-chain dehydrogenase [Actinoplanes sp. ATCC 53533]
MRLTGKVALVTGATGGIGAATARRFAAEGATVVVTDLDEDRCAALAEELRELGAVAEPRVLDVSDEEAWRRVVAEVAAALGGIHVLVNNAGIGRFTTVESETLETWNEVEAVTQRGVWLGMKHTGPAIEAAGGGAIVNVCSIFGTVGGFGSSFSYHAAKGAVRVMTKNAALHWAQRGVRVNSVHPGFIASGTLLERTSGTPRERAMLEGTPMRRLGRPDEVAGAIAFLAGADSTFMTGSELYVDGGWTAQ